MDTIKITFLGTGNAIPTKKRNHTGILASFGSECMLFDCGEGIQRQFRLAHISPTKLTRIFITHWHGDHILGLPGLFQTLAMSNYEKKLKIYGPIGTKKFISIIAQLLNDIKLNLEIHEIESGDFIDEKSFKLESENMDHGTPTLAYSLTIKDKLRLNKRKLKRYNLPNSPLIGKLQSGQNIEWKGKKINFKEVTYTEKGKKITLILDTKQNQNAEKIAKNSDLLICESSFSDSEKERAKEYKHLTAKQAAEIAKKAKVKKLIITHISQRYEHNLSLIEKEAKKTFKKVTIAKDLDSIEI